MNNLKFCKVGKHEVMEDEYYKQGKMCNACRNEMIKSNKESKTGNELAEYLLHQSCVRALERVKGRDNSVYEGFICQWRKPLAMKKELMAKSNFWVEWIHQTEVYEASGKVYSARPTIDRIESNYKKNGHYYIENLQVLSAGENSKKANAIRCITYFIKNSRIIRVSNFESMEEIMKELKILGHSVRSINRDTGQIQCIGNGYSVLVQTIGREMKVTKQLPYIMLIQKKLVLFDKITGRERVIKKTKSAYEVNGIWFDDSLVNAS